MNDETTNSGVVELPVSELGFDPHNPRFMDVFDNLAQVDTEAIARLLREENILELVASIGQRGYFSGEPLLVAPHPDMPEQLIVVEGNRRLAALKLLSGNIPINDVLPSLREAVEDAERHPLKVPCIRFSDRKNILRYLGYRHISGPRRWEALSKARYLADLIGNFYYNEERKDQLRLVARDIGSRPSYVAQLLTALTLYNRARDQKYFGLHGLDEDAIKFSLITTALSYTSIANFLGLQNREDFDALTLSDDRLKDLFAWMFVQNQQGETILGESRQLRLLAAVVDSEPARKELRKNGDLDKAYLFTAGPSEVLSDLLGEAHDRLSNCSEMALTIDADPSHLAQVEQIVKVVDGLQLLIQRGLQRRRRELASHE